jgi:carboxyl-terminal processing protease
LLAIMLPLAAVFAACEVAPSRATQTAPSTAPLATDTPAVPPATATPDPLVLLQDGGVALIRTAYDKLLDEYIDPLEPRSLLAQAWYGVQNEASTEGLSLPSAPVLSGDRVGDFAAFRDAYVPLAAQAADASKLRYAAIKTMASSLNDCHTFFLIPVASETLNGTRQGVGSVGIGVELAGVPPLITEVVAGGPAARVGVLVGDHIAAIDGSDATNLGPQGALDLINGTEGTNVGLRLRRAGRTDEIEVSIRRERVVPQNVESRLIGDTSVGYLRVRNFVDTGIAAPIRDALTQFEASGVTKWIIDLRGDPGGRMDAGAIGLFVPKGEVIERDRGRGGVTTDQKADGNTLPVIRPLVLITNNRTGSVAEAFAAALQEYGVAYVVGEKTNGCVGFTDISPLGDGSSIAVTTHVNLGPVSNKVLNGVGVIPDEAVTRTQADIANGDDPQLGAAVAHLRGG